MTQVPRIVLTGGPCAGKTTAISEMVTWAHETGYMPIVVPEAATLLMSSGLDVTTSDFQRAVLEHVLQTEASFLKHAEYHRQRGKKPVLICDRGLWDQAAYMSPSDFRALCLLHGVYPDREKGQRYDGVIFMRSAAVGAEEFYSNESNATRYESLAEAKALDERTSFAWAGVSHLGIIDNRVGEPFAGKIRRTVAEFSRILGVPAPMEIERKFDVLDFSESSLPAHTVKSDILQHYLLGDDGLVERVRARSYGEHWVFTHTIKQSVRLGVSVERERIVTRQQYEDLLVRVDRRREPIQKYRYCFLYQNHHFELDVFRNGKQKGRRLLEVEVGSLDDHVELPAFLMIGRELTDDPSATNYAMAQ